MRRAIAAVACACVLAGCASAPESVETTAADAAESAPLQAVAAVDPTRAAEPALTADDALEAGDVRCVDTVITGSRISRRVCLTEAEWERWRRDSQELLREWQGPKTQAR